MLPDSFVRLIWREFPTLADAAAYFHVQPVTVRRWLDGTIPINPMAEKLLLIKARGYLPNDLNWQGFRIDEDRAVLITPQGQVFHPRELDGFPYWRNQYHALVEKYGHVPRAPARPPMEPITQVYRGGRLKAAAPWIPTRDTVRKK